MHNDLRHFYDFGPFRVDAAERLLWRDGKALPLKPKTFDLLFVLVRRPGRVIEKDELMQQIWPDSFVEENNLADNIYKLRKVLGDGENGSRYIETVPKRGYRFVADVTRHENGESVLAMPQVAGSVTPDASEGQGIRVGTATPEIALPPSVDQQRRVLSVALAVFVLLSAAAVWWFAFRKKESAPVSALRVVPIIS